MLTHPQRNALVVVMGVVLSLCLASSALCVAGQTFLPGLPLPENYLMSVCGMFHTRPRVQLGVSWASPLFSAAIPPYGGPGAGCYLVPWLPALPQRGALHVP